MDIKVLVIDDSGIMLRTIKTLIEDMYTVKIVNSGAFALKFLQEDKYDVVLLDYDMPQMDGLQTFDAIRELDKGKNIPIIFLTGIDDKETISKIMMKNPSGYIVKPPGKDILIKMIDSVISMGD